MFKIKRSNEDEEMLAARANRGTVVQSEYKSREEDVPRMETWHCTAAADLKQNKED